MLNRPRRQSRRDARARRLLRSRPPAYRRPSRAPHPAGPIHLREVEAEFGRRLGVLASVESAVAPSEARRRRPPKGVALRLDDAVSMPRWHAPTRSASARDGRRDDSSRVGRLNLARRSARRDALSRLSFPWPSTPGDDRRPSASTWSPIAATSGVGDDVPRPSTTWPRSCEVDRALPTLSASYLIGDDRKASRTRCELIGPSRVEPIEDRERTALSLKTLDGSIPASASRPDRRGLFLARDRPRGLTDSLDAGSRIDGEDWDGRIPGRDVTGRRPLQSVDRPPLRGPSHDGRGEGGVRDSPGGPIDPPRSRPRLGRGQGALLSSGPGSISVGAAQGAGTTRMRLPPRAGFVDGLLAPMSTSSRWACNFAMDDRRRIGDPRRPGRREYAPDAVLIEGQRTLAPGPVLLGGCGERARACGTRSFPPSRPRVWLPPSRRPTHSATSRSLESSRADFGQLSWPMDGSSLFRVC